MNEFEWHRQLRDLRQPQLPPRDLWPSIDAALDRADAANAVAAPRRRRRHLLVAAGLAASALLVVGMAWQLRPTPHARPVVRSDAAAPAWKPSDPRLAGAAVEFTAARMELQQALQQAPDSPALRRLLLRTRQQQAQWQGRARDAG
ncbi:MAG: hypothetical protein ACTHL5_00250 [Rhodanobacter sp.]